jgi:hypothetical protein
MFFFGLVQVSLMKKIKMKLMNKSLTFILSITFLFLVGCSGNGEEPEVKKEFYDNGKL